MGLGVCLMAELGLGLGALTGCLMLLPTLVTDPEAKLPLLDISSPKRRWSSLLGSVE